MSMYIGEALVGDGNEVAHIDLLIGPKDGPWAPRSRRRSSIRRRATRICWRCTAPNLICKPATVLITKVTIKGAGRRCRCSGPPRPPSPRPSADSVAAGVIPKHLRRKLLHRLRRLHPLGCQGRRQDLPEQLRSHQAVDRPRHEGRAEDRRDPAKRESVKHPFSPK